jgi:hypothetical protein
MKNHFCSIATAAVMAVVCIGILAGCNPGIEDQSFIKENHIPVVQTAMTATAGTYPKFLMISDVHLGPGSTTKCDARYDSGSDIWSAAMKKITLVIGQENPEFILYTGDLPVHGGGSHDQMLGEVLKDLRDIATNNCLPLIYAPGNNDSPGRDYGPFTSGGKTPFDMDTGCPKCWPVIWGNPTSPSKGCSGGRPAPQIIDDNNIDLGYYSVYPLSGSKKLRMIVMNTVMFTNSYNGPNQDADITNQLTWLGTELKTACNNSEFVYLSMHIPPGTWGKKGVNGRFVRIVDGVDCISGIFYGHTHQDELKLILDSSNTKPKTLALSCPSISPYWQNNPGFKTVSYDPNQGFAPVEFKTYWANLCGTKGSYDHIIPHWDELHLKMQSSTRFDSTYTFSSAYRKSNPNTTMLAHLSSLYPNDLHFIKSDMHKISYVKSARGGGHYGQIVVNYQSASSSLSEESVQPERVHEH